MILKQAEQYAWRLALISYPSNWDVPMDEPHFHMTTKAANHYKLYSPEPDDMQEMTLAPSLTKSVKREGVQRPLVIETDGVNGVLGDGHHRLEAANRAGMSHVPVRVSRMNLDDYGPNEVKPIEPELKGWLQGHGH